MGEGAAPGILTAEPDGIAFQQKRAKAQRFGCSPIKTGARFKHRPLCIEDPFELWMDPKTFGSHGKFLTDLAQGLFIHR